jgi:hypothetical protein
MPENSDEPKGSYDKEFLTNFAAETAADMERNEPPVLPLLPDDGNETETEEAKAIEPNEPLSTWKTSGAVTPEDAVRINSEAFVGGKRPGVDY